MKNTTLLGVYTRVMFATLFWGANFVLISPVLQDLPPLWAAEFRFLLAALMLLVVSAWQGIDLLEPIRKHLWAYIGLAAVGIVAFNLFFFFAMETASATNGALIMATNPLMTTLLAYVVLSERPTLRQWLALPLAFIGVAIVLSNGDLTHVTHLDFVIGDLLMLAANLTWALYNVLSRRYMPAGAPLTNTAAVMSFGALLLLLVALSSNEQFVWPGVNAGGALLLMALGGTALAYLFWIGGIARLGAGRTAIFMNMVPVFAVLTGVIFGTVPTHVQMVGGLLVIGSVTVAMLPGRRS